MLNAALQGSSTPVAVGAVGDVRLGFTDCCCQSEVQWSPSAMYLLGEDAATAMLLDIW